MPTGACGINCDVCWLNLAGICSPCGSGRSDQALRKIAAQQRILGAPCPILECAVTRQVEFCPRDCTRFPCERFMTGPYPYSEAYLKMQGRRRRQKPPLISPSGSEVEVPVEYWDDLNQRDSKLICAHARVRNDPPNGLLLPFFNEYLLVDKQKRQLYRQGRGSWEPIDHPLLELICLVYLLNCGPQALGGEIISVRELKTGHFFTGPHELKIQPLLVRYGNDIEAFKETAERVGGVRVDLADASYRISALPKVPLYYLMWRGDEEFHPRISILFDRSVENHLAADAIWGLVNLVSDILLLGMERAVFDPTGVRSENRL